VHNAHSSPILGFDFCSLPVSLSLACAFRLSFCLCSFWPLFRRQPLLLREPVGYRGGRVPEGAASRVLAFQLLHALRRRLRVHRQPSRALRHPNPCDCVWVYVQMTRSARTRYGLAITHRIAAAVPLVLEEGNAVSCASVDAANAGCPGCMSMWEANIPPRGSVRLVNHGLSFNLQLEI